MEFFRCSGRHPNVAAASWWCCLDEHGTIPLLNRRRRAPPYASAGRSFMKRIRPCPFIVDPLHGQRRPLRWSCCGSNLLNNVDGFGTNLLQETLVWLLHNHLNTRYQFDGMKRWAYFTSHVSTKLHAGAADSTLNRIQDIIAIITSFIMRWKIVSRVQATFT